MTIQIVGDFDDAMQRVRTGGRPAGNIYLMNSINPFRLEGQKTIMYRVLEPARLGAARLDRRARRQPRQFERLRQGVHRAQGTRADRQGSSDSRSLTPPAPGRSITSSARTAFDLERRFAGSTSELTRAYYGKPRCRQGLKASTIASAIEINRPVNLKKCLRALNFCDGVVRQVSDQEIMDAKARVGAGGLGCEPASAASVAGARKLREEGVIAPSDSVVCILTGHQLKDPTATVAYHGTDQDNFEKVLGSRGVRRAGFANRPVIVPNDLDDIIRTIALYSEAGS